LAAQQADEATQKIRERLLEIHRLCQPSPSNDGNDSFNALEEDTFSKPLTDIEKLLANAKTTRKQARMLRTVAQRYRLDPRLEAVYVRPLAKAPPLLQQTADGDMASRKLSGPLSNAVYHIPESDAALTLRVQ
jgi:hypothetical protein